MEQLNQESVAKRNASIPAFGPGDQVRVWCRIIERDRVRLTPFEGIVVRRRGAGMSETFIVRRITHGEGVERVFPIHAPIIDKIELLQQGKPRRARLYFLRTRVGKVRIATVQTTGPAKSSQPASPEPAATSSPERQPDAARPERAASPTA